MPTVEVDADAIPEELKQRDQWLLWDARADRPKQPHWDGDHYGISWSDPDDWHTFDEAAEAAEKRDEWGVGYVCAADNDDYPRGIYGVIDLDGVVADDRGAREWAPTLRPFLKRDAYAEYSQSETGLHVPVAGIDVPDWWRDVHRSDEEHEGIEVLENKFCIFTGDTEREAGDDVVDYGEWVDEWLADAYEAVTGEEPPRGQETALGEFERESDERAGKSASYDDETVPRETVEDALDALPGRQHFDEWVRTGYAVYSWDDGETGKDVFEEWSRSNPKWEEEESQRQIDYIWSEGDSDGDRDGNVSVGTLFHLAKEHGWQPSGPPEWKKIVVENSDVYDSVAEVPDDPGELKTVDREAAEQPATAGDGGTASAWEDADPPDYASELTPDALKIVAEVDQDESIRDLDDREKAAAVWELCGRSNEVFVRVRRDNQSLWAYDSGVWKPEGKRALRHAARSALPDRAYGSNVFTELKEFAKSDPRVEVEADEFGVEPGQVAVENGLLDLKDAADGADDALRKLKPNDLALTRLPVTYDREAGYDEWQGYVEEWAEDGRADALQEFVGYCLHVGELPIHRVLLLVGGGSNGKGTFLHVVRELLGEENTSAIELQTLANEKDARADFYGSLANIDDDLSARKIGQGLGMFKKLAAGDRVRARQLYEDGFEFEATAKHLYAANEVPEVDVPEDDDAFWRRWLLVEFPNHYPAGQREHGLKRRLAEPERLSGVLNWAIEGRQRLLEQGYFTNEDRYPYEKCQRWRKWGDSIKRFTEEVCERDEDAPRRTTSDVHRVYAAWCRDVGEDPVGQQKLTNSLKTEGFGYKPSLRVDGSPTRGYEALGFSDDAPDVEETPARGDDPGQQSITD
jgi:putative DNA primase/helicase